MIEMDNPIMSIVYSLKKIVNGSNIIDRYRLNLHVLISQLANVRVTTVTTDIMAEKIEFHCTATI